VKFQQRGWPRDDGFPQDPAWREKQRPEAEQNSVNDREIGCAAPRPVDDQELLLHEEAVGNHRSCATGSQELGDIGEQMYQEDEKVLHGELA
jgi:hypothetical protein